MESFETKSSIGLKLKSGAPTIDGGQLTFSPTFHYRISVTLLEPYHSKEEAPKAQYLRDYDVEELDMEIAFKEVENFMDHLKHFFQRGTSY